MKGMAISPLFAFHLVSPSTLFSLLRSPRQPFIMRSGSLFVLVSAVVRSFPAGAVPIPPLSDQPTVGLCRRTTVAVLGAGVAGVIAAQTLHNNSIEDFVIIDRN